MRIGVPREVKDHEYRVGLIPASVHALVADGHRVAIERGAGEGSGISDQEYVEAGAEMLADADSVWAESEMIVKVKEPVAEEFGRLQDEQLLFTYLHLAPLPELTEVLCSKRITGVAYETITDAANTLPLLTPMSEVAGRMATLVGNYYLQRPYGGRGTLLCGVPGVPPGDVVIIGGGIVGLNAARVAHGLGARVTILDTNVARLRHIDDLYKGAITTLASNHHNVLAAMARADLVVGAVLIPGRSAPKLITREMLAEMKPGSVLVDVAVDQGGCAETTRATTHSNPIYEVDGVVHYCVANMPGAVPRTSTFALNSVTLPYACRLANAGIEGLAELLKKDRGLFNGVNTYQGKVVYEAVAESQERAYQPLDELLAS